VVFAEIKGFLDLGDYQDNLLKLYERISDMGGFIVFSDFIEMGVRVLGC
jgi:hypothetical protein